MASATVRTLAITTAPFARRSPTDASANAPSVDPAPTADSSSPSPRASTPNTSAAYTGISPCMDGITKIAGSAVTPNSISITGWFSTYRAPALRSLKTSLGRSAARLAKATRIGSTAATAHSCSAASTASA